MVTQSPLFTPCRLNRLPSRQVISSNSLQTRAHELQEPEPSVQHQLQTTHLYVYFISDPHSSLSQIRATLSGQVCTWRSKQFTARVRKEARREMTEVSLCTNQHSAMRILYVQIHTVVAGFASQHKGSTENFLRCQTCLLYST